MRERVLLLLVLAGCAPDRYWVRPDDLANARAVASPTVPAVRADDGAPTRAFVDELQIVPGPARPDGSVLAATRPISPAEMRASARALRAAALPQPPPGYRVVPTQATLARRGRVLIIIGAVLAPVGAALAGVGAWGVADWGPPPGCTFLCFDFRFAGALVLAMGVLMELGSIGTLVPGVVLRRRAVAAPSASW